MTAVNDVRLDDAAITDLLTNPRGPVGELLAELSERAAAVARATVRVRSGRGGSTAYPPGYTLESIHPVLARGSYGLYGGVNAAEDPTVFLEDPAEQMHGKYPFLTTGLWSLEGTV